MKSAFAHFDSRRGPRLKLRKRRRTGRPRLRNGLVTSALFLAGDAYTTSTGERIIHAQQSFGGLQVFRSFLVVRARRGRVRRTPVLFSIPSRLTLRPEIDARSALRAAMAWLGKNRALESSVRFSVTRESQFRELSSMPTVIELRYGLKEPVRLRLEVFPAPRDEAQLVWVMDIALRNGRRYHMAVLATGARPVVLFNASTNTCAFDADWLPIASVQERRTFPIPPFATSAGGPGAASDWQDVRGRASGPNVSCHLEDAPGADALGTLSVDNAFVWSNVLHDFFEAFGFDTDHHAFEDSDPLRLERRGERNHKGGEFENHLDGYRPLVALYASPAGAARHAARDPGILIHEYTHGVSSRLVGGTRCTHPFLEQEAWAFSEAMSDFFALTVVNYIARSRRAAESFVFGGIFRPGGLRNYTGYSGRFDPNDPNPYSMGMSFCASLLDASRPITALAGDPAKTDRFLWQASINTFKSMVPICQKSLGLTLAHAKNALVAEIAALEDKWGLAGAAAVAEVRFRARGIR